ncbi:MAG: MarR family transcriptional regulator [Candidatus Lokiarchaeota archaeon]|nr:MarR family transcriptional regulator [Candidatus Lokiarchaeota archaeon]
MPIHELVEQTQLTKSTLSSHLDSLESLGFIKKIPSKEDKREIFVILSEKTKNLNQKYLEVSKHMTKLFYDGFTDKEIDQFEKYLRQCIQNLAK